MTVELPSGGQMPKLGIGSWGWAEDPRKRPDEIASLQLAIELGMTLVDTAEMYAQGGAESLIGKGLVGRRDEVFLVSKVLPNNASRAETVEACERSLRRLQTDRLDMYLLHWRGPYPLQATVDAFGELVEAGKIRYWGVSNFDVDDVEELMLQVRGGTAFQTDQVLYNLLRRGIEWDLLPLLRKHRVPIMAYSPLERGQLLRHPVLREMAEVHDATAAQIALAWVLSRKGVAVIPKASNPDHVRENSEARRIELTREDLDVLAIAFPPPSRRAPLEVL